MHTFMCIRFPHQVYDMHNSTSLIKRNAPPAMINGSRDPGTVITPHVVVINVFAADALNVCVNYTKRNTGASMEHTYGGQWFQYKICQRQDTLNL